MGNTEDRIKQFLKEYGFRLAGNTLENYQFAVEKFFEFIQKEYNQIKARDVRLWLEELNKKGFKTGTIRNRISGLRLFFKYCMEDNLIKKDPMENVDIPKLDDSLPSYLNLEQLNQLRELTKSNPIHRVIVETLYTTGVRICELVTLKLEDINWELRLIDIKKGKGNKERMVPFNYQCEQRLRDYLNKRVSNSPYLFINTKGRPYNIRTVQHHFERFSKILELKITPHTLRHTFAAHLAEKGMPLVAIQTLLGHDNIRETRIYARLCAQARKKVYDRYI